MEIKWGSCGLEVILDSGQTVSSVENTLILYCYIFCSVCPLRFGITCLFFKSRSASQLRFSGSGIAWIIGSSTIWIIIINDVFYVIYVHEAFDNAKIKKIIHLDEEVRPNHQLYLSTKAPFPASPKLLKSDAILSFTQ